MTIFVGTALIGVAYFAYLDWLHNPDKGGALVLPDFDPIGSICETVHGEDPAGKTGKGSSWQTHSDRRAGERYGKDRNANRGDKNKKYEKPKNKNKLKKDK